MIRLGNIKFSEDDSIEIIKDLLGENTEREAVENLIHLFLEDNEKVNIFQESKKTKLLTMG